MRFFIALEIPEQSRIEIEKIQFQLKQLIPELKLTEIQKLHLTMAFIADKPPEFEQQLLQVINHAILNIPPFFVTPSFIDGFPNIHHPGVLWIGVKGEVDKLHILRERIKDGLTDLQLEVDERRYTPHIAIAKLSDFYITPQMEEQFISIMSNPLSPIKISEVKLFESIPNHGFHSHNTLAKIAL